MAIILPSAITAPLRNGVSAAFICAGLALALIYPGVQRTIVLVLESSTLSCHKKKPRHVGLSTPSPR